MLKLAAEGTTVNQAYELYLQGKLTEQEFEFFLLMRGGPAATPTPTPAPGELASALL
jgi:hypothetical protein